jgi:hypothetical protein
MKDSVRKMVEEFKDEPYNLCGCSGTKTIRSMDGNSTVTKTNARKSESICPIREEICQMIKSIDKNHPVGVCNATQNLSKFMRNIPKHRYFRFQSIFRSLRLWNSVAKSKTDFDRPVLIPNSAATPITVKKHDG